MNRTLTVRTPRELARDNIDLTGIPCVVSSQPASTRDLTPRPPLHPGEGELTAKTFIERPELAQSEVQN